MTGMVFCRGCGKEIHSTAPMCPMCGAPQMVAQAVPPAMHVAPAATSNERTDYASRPDISESWKRKFALIEKAGGPKLPNFRILSVGERMQVGFNILAFLFGPIYYLIKGLWQQALAYTGIYLGAVILVSAIGNGSWVQFVSYGVAGLFAARANVGYYKKEVLREVTWL